MTAVKAVGSEDPLRDFAIVMSGPVAFATVLKNMAFDWPVEEMDWNFCVKLVVAELTTAPPSRLETPVTPRVVLADKEVNAPANGVVVPITTLLIWLPPPEIVPDNVTAGIGPTMVVAAPTDVIGPVRFVLLAA